MHHKADELFGLARQMLSPVTSMGLIPDKLLCMGRSTSETWLPDLIPSPGPVAALVPGLSDLHIHNTPPLRLSETPDSLCFTNRRCPRLFWGVGGYQSRMI